MLDQWPMWLDDYIAGALLLYAWHSGKRPYLMAAWGYCLGIAYMSLFGHLQSTAPIDPSGVARQGVLAFKAFGLCLTATCLALTWRSTAD